MSSDWTGTHPQKCPSYKRLLNTCRVNITDQACRDCKFFKVLKMLPLEREGEVTLTKDIIINND